MIDLTNKISFFYEYTASDDFNVIDEVTQENKTITLHFNKKDEETTKVVSQNMNETETSDQLVYASSQASLNNEAWKVFDYTDESVIKCWISSGIPSDSNPEFIALQFKQGPIVIDKYSIQNRFSEDPNEISSPRKWILQGSNDDGNTWTDLHKVDDSTDNNSDSKNEYELPFREEYSTYRLMITARNGLNTYCSIKSIELISSPYNYQKNLGTYENDVSLVNGINDIELNGFNLTISTNEGSFQFDDFIIEPTYTDSNAIGIGLKSSDENVFKPVVSNTVEFVDNGNEVVFRNKEFTTDSSGPIGTLTCTFLTFSVEGTEEGFYTVESDNVEKYRIVPFNGVSGISGITLNPDGSFKMLPGRYYIDFSLTHGVSETGQAVLVNLNTDEIIHYSVGYTNQFPGVKKTNMSVLTGYVEILTNDNYAIKVLGTDLGSYYIDGFNNSAIISTCNIYLVKRFDFAIKPVLLDLITENEYDYSPYIIFEPMVSNNNSLMEVSSDSNYTEPYLAISGRVEGSGGGWISNKVATELEPVFYNIVMDKETTVYEYSFNNIKTIINQDGAVINAMTSDTSGNQVSTANGTWSGSYAPWKAFNYTNTGSTDCWYGPNDSYPKWLQIEFTDGPRTINRYTIVNRIYRSPMAIRSWILYGKMSHDVDWTIVDQITDDTRYTSGLTRDFPLSTEYTFDMFRIHISQGQASQTAIAGMYFYLDANEVTENIINSAVLEWDLEGRNSADDVWEFIEHRSDILNHSSGDIRKYVLQTPVRYKEYRFKITNSNNAYASFSNLMFYKDPLPMARYRLTSSSNYSGLYVPWQTRAKNSIRLETNANVWASANGNVADPQWLEMTLNESLTIDSVSLTGSIQSPDARELSLDFILQGNSTINIVSPMTSIDSAGQVSNSSSNYTTAYTSYMAFNQTGIETANCWASSSVPSPTNPQWLSIAFNEIKEPIVRYTITNREATSNNNVGAPSKWYLQGRDSDDSDWIDIDYREDINSVPGVTREFILDEAVNYRQYRLFITAADTSNPWVTVADLSLYTGAGEWDTIFTSPDKTINTIGSNHYYFLDNPVTYRRYRWYYEPLNTGTYGYPYRTIGRVQFYKKIP